MKPNIFPKQAKEIGLLPILNKPVRFAVGAPNGLTSNSWRIWSTKNGDVYIKCRDNFTEAKVSLHTSARWRMGFTTEALRKKPDLVRQNQNRAWEVWDKPPELIPDCVAAFQIVFARQELAVRPEQRKTKKWKNVIFIEEPPNDKLVIMTLFITRKDIELNHESEPSFCLASFELNNGSYAKIIIHSDKIGDFKEKLEKKVAAIIKEAKSKNIIIPEEAFVYFYGKKDGGIRYISGARAKRNV